MISKKKIRIVSNKTEKYSDYSLIYRMKLFEIIPGTKILQILETYLTDYSLTNPK